MKKLIALLVALMMLFSAAAVAEESTLCRLSLYDPIVYIDSEPVIDMAGLNIDLDAIVTDSGLLGAMLELYTGENYDFLTGAYAQVDQNGLSFYMDGMSNIYTYDVAPYLGTGPINYTATMPLRSAVKSVDYSAIKLDVSIPAEVRIAAMQELFGGMVVSSANGESTLELTKEQGAALVSGIQEFASQLVPVIGAYAGEIGISTSDIEEVLASVSAFDASGVMSASDSVFSVSVTGNIYDAEGNSIPVAFTYDDVITEAALTLDIANGTAVIDWVIGTDDETGGVTQSALFSSANSTTSVGISLSTGIAESDNSFTFDFDIYEGEEYASYLYLYYEGNYEDSDDAPYTYGYFEGGVYDGVTEYALGTSIILESVDCTTEDWLMDSSSAIDVASMSENETNTALLGLMGILGNTLPTLQTNVPGLAPYIEMLTESMFG